MTADMKKRREAEIGDKEKEVKKEEIWGNYASLLKLFSGQK